LPGFITDAPDASQFAQQIMARVQGLKQDWDKAQSVYEAVPSLDREAEQIAKD